MSRNQRPRLGPFEIGELIGTGGFASVYRAYDQRLNCDVAIKILADNHALNPDVRERFIREAQAMRLIDSPNVLSLYDIGETPDGRPYLVLEFADRGGLMERRRRCISDGWQPNSVDVGYLVTALADALAPVHAEQLVHRDVTPSNVLIRSANSGTVARKSSLFAPDERLMLSDLGLVKDLLVSSGLTAGSGTAGFAAPEQQHSLTTIDTRNDVYSATAVVLWLIAGQSPQAIDDVEGLLAQEGWPKPFVDAVLAGLADQPDDRHETVGEWKADLLSSLPLDDADSSLAGRSGRVPRRVGRRRRRIRYALVGMLAVAGAAAAARTYWPDDPADTGKESAAPIASEQLQSQVEQPEEATLPIPDLQHIFFEEEGDRTVLTIIWGSPDVPPDVVATDVAVRVDGGNWVIEKQAPHGSVRGWQLYSTEVGDDSDRRQVTYDSEYVARIRWVFEDGTVSDWSRNLTAAIPG